MTAFKSRRIAKAGEDSVADYLEERGYTILERNWRNGRHGELDLIARGPHGVNIFVEVKTRSTDVLEPGIPTSGFETITSGKQRKIIRAAKSYLAMMKIQDEARFDAALVATHSVGTGTDFQVVIDEIVYVEGAFHPK
ncbi:MAG: YraN family protein [Candidatus Obscuribacterales bacterium]|nr:YraN family protein [Candidatus Obscuribacterales bacterium]